MTLLMALPSCSSDPGGSSVSVVGVPGPSGVAEPAATQGGVPSDSVTNVVPDNPSGGVVPNTVVNPETPGDVVPPGAGATPGVVAPPGAEVTPGIVDPPLPVKSACETHGPGASAAEVKRLSRAEYRASVQDLLGQPDFEAGDFIASVTPFGFVSVGDALGSTPQLEGYFAEAQRIAEAAVAGLPELANRARLGNNAFVREFLQDFGRKVLRRPLSETDVDDYFGIYTKVKALGNGAEGLTWALAGLFSSPDFIYRVERAAVGAGEGLADVEAFDRASRLSYFLTGSTPDEELLLAAEQGELQTPAGVRTQAERLMSTARGRQRLATFVLEWLELEGGKADPALLRAIDPDNPTLEDDVKQSVIQAVASNADGSAASGSASFGSLLTQKGIFLNDSLAASLGVTAGGSDFSLVPAEGRFGLLTHPALMALHSTETFAKATIRGAFVMEKVVCQQPPEAPEGAEFPEFTRDQWLSTQRETLETLHAKDGCKGCHTLIDGFGYPFENYDSHGQYVTQEQSPSGQVSDIDSSGRVWLDGESQVYESAEQFTAILAKSPSVHACMSRQLIRFAMRREDKASTNDACTIEQVGPSFGGASTLADAFVEFTQTPAFLSQRVSASAEAL